MTHNGQSHLTNPTTYSHLFVTHPHLHNSPRRLYTRVLLLHVHTQEQVHHNPLHHHPMHQDLIHHNILHPHPMHYNNPLHPHQVHHKPMHPPPLPGHMMPLLLTGHMWRCWKRVCSRWHRCWGVQGRKNWWQCWRNHMVCIGVCLGVLGECVGRVCGKVCGESI